MSTSIQPEGATQHGSPTRHLLLEISRRNVVQALDVTVELPEGLDAELAAEKITEHLNKPDSYIGPGHDRLEVDGHLLRFCERSSFQDDVNEAVDSLDSCELVIAEPVLEQEAA